MNPITHQLPRGNVRQGEEDDGHGDVEELVHGSEHHQPVEVTNIGFNFSVNYFQSLLSQCYKINKISYPEKYLICKWIFSSRRKGRKRVKVS